MTTQSQRQVPHMQKLRFTPTDDVIFTTYFFSKQNPQPNRAGDNLFAPKNSISYIFPWYVSVRHLGLNAVVIHDGLSDEFIAEHESDNLQFIYHEPDRYSLNDERYIALQKILEQNELRRVLMTDGSDLLIKKNPFEFIADSGKMYFGSDMARTPRIRDNAWCLNKMTALMEASQGKISVDESFLDFEYINAGVYGGSYANVKSFTEGLVSLFEVINNDKNNNMMAINYLLWKFKIPYFKGQPLTSKFKEFEMHGDYYIVHK